MVTLTTLAVGRFKEFLENRGELKTHGIRIFLMAGG